MSSHKQILKSSGIIGGSQVITIFIGIIRTKAIALLLGPAGVGLAGMLASTTGLVGSFTGLGLGFSAVRDIAEASGSGDDYRIAKTIKVMRRLVWGSGLLGMGLTIAFCRLLSRMTFNTNDYAFEIALLSITLLLGAISAGQSALLQGLRRIRQMALAGVIGSAVGLVTTLPLYWMLGTKGIVPALVLASVSGLFFSWWFARQVKTLSVQASLHETLRAGWPMVKLGVCMTASGLMGTGCMYLVRIWIARHLDLGAVGQFQAAWGIATTYLGLVLGAMGADYYPRLTSVNKNHDSMIRLVNEQIEVALVLSGPLIVGMITFMPLVVWLLYSGKFAATAGILRWQIAGDLFKVVTWSLGYVILAKGVGSILVLTEFLWNVTYLGLIVLLWNRLGLNSTGIAFFISYVLYVLIIFIVGWHLIRFRLSPQVIRLGVFYIAAVFMAILNAHLCPAPWCYVTGGLIFALVCLFSLRKLHHLVGGSAVIANWVNRVRQKISL